MRKRRIDTLDCDQSNFLSGGALDPIGAAGVVAFLWFVTIPPAEMETWRLRQALMIGTAIFGLGRGVSLLVSARRRLGILGQMGQAAAARVVQGNSDGTSPR